METQETSSQSSKEELFYGESEDTNSTDAGPEDTGEGQVEVAEGAQEAAKDKPETVEAKPGDEEEGVDKESKDKASEDTEKPEEEEESKEALDLKKEDLKLKEDSPLKQEDLDQLFDEATQLGLNKDQAQAFVKAKEDAYSQFKTDADVQFSQIKEGWFDEAANDPEIGGDKLAENSEYSKRALTHYGTEDFKSWLIDTGFGNHPEVVRMFSKIGRDMSDDKRIVGSDPSPSQDMETYEHFYGKD